MPKRIRIESDYEIYFVTFSVHNFIPIFARQVVARKFVRVLRFYEVRSDYVLHAYVIMPEHVHLLMECTCNRGIGAIIRDIKKYFAFIYRKELLDIVGPEQFMVDGRFRLWQRGFDEVTISSEAQYYVKLKYIVNNPVKRGLSIEPGQYEFCFCADFDGLNRRI
ncbi:MAG: transposase [Candidatus Zixiibacteriota bacterium]|nr:MAG: transposase [candidate division Zixibacteria bacterium]